jgi:glycerophosphoryl diester phosphodiesterase
MARQMEQFLALRKIPAPQSVQAAEPMRIWGHRGCCMRYPENTLPAFEAAAKLDGITGIELDVQLTTDGELVVIHDEKVDRTTTGTGQVRDFTLQELKRLRITGSGRAEAYLPELTVPTLREVFDLMRPYCVERGILINIELKNSNVRYEGMEQKVLKLVEEYGLESFIIYSSFLHESMGLVKELNPTAKTGTLAVGIHDCMLGAKKYHADALHPSISGLDINCDAVRTGGWGNMPVRAWNSEEPFYGQERPLRETHMTRYARLGVTDLITNVPELYLKEDIIFCRQMPI